MKILSRLKTVSDTTVFEVLLCDKNRKPYISLVEEDGNYFVAIWNKRWVSQPMTKDKKPEKALEKYIRQTNPEQLEHDLRQGKPVDGEYADLFWDLSEKYGRY